MGSFGCSVGLNCFEVRMPEQFTHEWIARSDRCQRRFLSFRWFEYRRLNRHKRPVPSHTWTASFMPNPITFSLRSFSLSFFLFRFFSLLRSLCFCLSSVGVAELTSHSFHFSLNICVAVMHLASLSFGKLIPLADWGGARICMCALFSIQFFVCSLVRWLFSSNTKFPSYVVCYNWKLLPWLAR